MIEDATVLVLGAGASAPFGFPTGQRLKNKITEPTFLDSHRGTLANLGYERPLLDQFVSALMRSGRSSVDAFLEHRKDFEGIGKAAIAMALLPHEKTDPLFENRDGERQGDNWYELLFGVIADGVSFEDVGNNLNIITFNYDRSLEQYLFTALQNSYHVTAEQCAEQIAKIPIVHVHGSLGRLPWQAKDDQTEEVPYDSTGSRGHVASAAQSINIISQVTSDTPEFQQARQLLLEAKRVFFLGFGFHPTNLKRLAPDGGKITGNIWCTSYQLSVDRKADAKRWHTILQHEEHLIPTPIYPFLHDEVSLSGK